MMERLRLLWGDLQAWYLRQTGDLQTWYLRLTARERLMVATAGGGGLVFVVFLTLFLLATAADSTRRRTETKLRRLAEAEQLATGYAEAERARKQAEADLTGNEVSLITYLEEKGGQAGLDIPSLTPKGDVPAGEDGRIVQSTVELTLTDVQLTKLVNFLSAVERGPGVVRVKSLRVEPRPKDSVLTAWITIAAYRLKANP
jgi:general secretion pathway protein M